MGQKWESRYLVHHDAVCPLCDGEFFYSREVTATLSEAATRPLSEVKDALARKIEIARDEELARDRSADVVKCPWCGQMPAELLKQARFQAVTTTVFGLVLGAAGFGLAAWLMGLTDGPDDNILLFGLAILVGLFAALFLVVIPATAIKGWLSPDIGTKAGEPRPKASAEPFFGAPKR